MTGKSRSFCPAPAWWLQSPRSQEPDWMEFFLPVFCYTWPNTTGCFIVCHRTEARQHCLDGVFKAPLSVLAHNYFYKSSPQLPHSLPTPLSSSSCFLQHGCWNFDMEKGTCCFCNHCLPPCPCLPREACQLIILSSGGQGWPLVRAQHAGIFLWASTSEHNSNTNILTKQYLK